MTRPRPYCPLAIAVVPFMTPSVESQFCHKEWQLYLEHELARAYPGEGVALIYTVTVPGFLDAGAKLDEWQAGLKRRQYVDLREWREGGAEQLHQNEVRSAGLACDSRGVERL